MYMMNEMKPKHARGVALVQVLFITAILSLMALHFTLTSRQQVDIAATLQDKVAAELQLVSWKSELLFALLTAPTVADAVSLQPDNDMTKSWNFHGKAFTPAENVTMHIQDIEGLLSISSVGKKAQLQSVLSYLQLDAETTQRVVADLEQQQGLPSSAYRPSPQPVGRNMFIQSITELKSFSGVTPAIYDKLSKVVTRLPVVRTNPLHVPDMLLQALLPTEIADQVVMLRQNGELTAARYSRLVGIVDYENYSFVRGERLLVQIEVSYGTAVAKQYFICYIRPENQFPLIWLD
jgi:general secretion pathway protein K